VRRFTGSFRSVTVFWFGLTVFMKEVGDEEQNAYLLSRKAEQGANL
jgi:hypothetical protein